MSSSNNPQKNIGAPSSSFVNPLAAHPSAAQNQAGTGFPTQYMLTPAQLQAFAQAQAHAQAQAQFQAHLHAQYRAHLQAQGILSNQPARTGGITNLGSPPPSGLAAGTSSGRRSAQKQPMLPPLPAVAPTNTVSPMKAMEASNAARRKKLKLPEKQPQEKLETLLPESDFYSQLLELESHVDALMMRKKIDIQEASTMPMHIQKTLRIYVFNTSANQGGTSSDKPNAEPPTWTLKIVGRILEEGMNSKQAETMQKSSSEFPKLSSFFKRVTITLDPNLYPDNHFIVWDSTQSPVHHEGFEVKRIGDQEFTAAIRFEMNYLPEKFKLSQPLTELLGIEVETRPRILSAMWHYIRARKLQCPGDPSSFYCDKPLHQVFGEVKLKLSDISERLEDHLFRPQPIRLDHRIRLLGENPVGDACYDVLVDIPFPAQGELNALLDDAERNKELEACDKEISAAIRKLREHQRRRAFFLGFSQSPVEFINKLTESQNKDMKLITADAGRNVEKVRQADFYKQPWVEDAVIRYINKKAPGKGPSR